MEYSFFLCGLFTNNPYISGSIFNKIGQLILECISIR